MQLKIEVNVSSEYFFCHKMPITPHPSHPNKTLQHRCHRRREGKFNQTHFPTGQVGPRPKNKANKKCEPSAPKNLRHAIVNRCHVIQPHTEKPKRHTRSVRKFLNRKSHESEIPHPTENTPQTDEKKFPLPARSRDDQNMKANIQQADETP